MEYARIAHQFTLGHFPEQNHFSYRLSLLIPTAVSYLLFGVNDFASVIPPLLASSAILFFILLFLKEQAPKTLFLALSFCLFSPWFLNYTDMIMPDIYVCLAYVAAVYFLWRAEFEQGSPTYNGWGLSISLLFGFMAKGTIILIAPLIILIFINHTRKRKTILFWMHAIGSGLVLLFSYFFASYLLTGNALMRFNVIGENSYLNRCSYADQNMGILLNRISIDFLDMIQRDHLLFQFIFLVALAAFLLLKKKAQSNTTLFFLSSTALILLVSSNFMSISLKAYNPMCLDIRHYLFLIPLSSIPLAILISKVEIIKQLRWWLIACVIAVLSFSYYMGNQDFMLSILPFGIVLLVYLIGIDQKGIQKTVYLAIPLVLLFKPIDMVQKSRILNYEGQRDFVMENILGNEESKVIITDAVQAHLGNYYLGFETDRIKFYDFRFLELTDSLKAQEVYYLENYHSAQLSFVKEFEIPYFLKKATKNKAIEISEKLGLKIYKVNDFKEIKNIESLLFREINDFEGEIDEWSGSSDLLSKDPLSSSNKVSQTQTYSSTFQLQMDSLKQMPTDLYISASCDIFAEASSQAKLVISVENEEGNYFWHAQEVDPLIKSYSNWWEVRLDKTLSSSEYKKGSLLKVYIWNPGEEPLLLDELKVELYQL